MLTTLKSKLKAVPAIRRLAKAVGMSSADPGHDHYHGDVARGYLQKRLKQEYWHREQEVVREMLQPMANGLQVLDVPVGTGRFVEMYLEKGMHVSGIDISRDMLDAAKQALGPLYDQCEMLQGSADELPYADNRFDLVVCFRFFGLIPLGMSKKVLAEIRRVCKGQVIIRVPVRKATAPRLPPAGESERVQGRLYEPEILALFAAYGLRPVDQRTINEREHVAFVVYLLQRVDG
jgi:ubiquinone/menaquinone biosynthesis C-methylase UbiE